jgi:CDP-glucose 4,6-dehydratase
MHDEFLGYYQGKTILVTGHTGFKGSWLCIWLKLLGAKVVGYALAPPTSTSNFEISNIEQHITHVHGDVLDFEYLQSTIQAYQPDLIFHLAAQSLVPRSVRFSRETFEVNMMGTVNLLDAALATPAVQAVISITSDKCYLNVGWEWAYREIDTLGGTEPYSASKACAELIIKAYQSREFQNAKGRKSYLPIASVRAGNVIGGGDWAEARLIPDIARALAESRPIHLRSPGATRPWQHVLEPLSGYLWLGANIVRGEERYVTGWNFGPVEQVVAPVGVVVEKFINYWPAPDTQVITDTGSSVHEAMLLALDCSKARTHLNWTGNWLLDETLAATAAWYTAYYHGKDADMYQFSKDQIRHYTKDAIGNGQAWGQKSSG